MATFVWEGRNRAGEVKKGTMEADSENAVTQRLRDQNIAIIKVKKKAKDIEINIGTGVSTKDVVIFARQFATMIDAGLPLVQALDILGSQSDNKRFGKILIDVKQRVEGGSSFSDALRHHPKIFDDLFTNMVQAGEVGGILDTILNRLATYMEKAVKLKAKVKGAMVYPIAISLIAIGVVVILLWKVIPVFEKMFVDMGAGALPKITQLVLDASRWFQRNVVIIFGAMIGFVFAWKALMRTRKGRHALHKFLLRMPIIGPTLRKAVVARFTRTFGTLLASGVPILDAMEICARTSGNYVIEEAILGVRERVSEGKDIAGPLMQSRVFPPMVVQMIGVGEQTGQMDTMLSKIADFYEDEVDTAVAALTSLMEPAMMVILGGLVGTILISMYLPIFEIAGNVSGH